MQNKTDPAPSAETPAREQPAPRFVETSEPRRKPLPTLRTEEEARLAAEIEKLRS
jgi:hypothetical protein